MRDEVFVKGALLLSSVVAVAWNGMFGGGRLEGIGEDDAQGFAGVVGAAEVLHFVCVAERRKSCNRSIYNDIIQERVRENRGRER